MPEPTDLPEQAADAAKARRAEMVAEQVAHALDHAGLAGKGRKSAEDKARIDVITAQIQYATERTLP